MEKIWHNKEADRVAALKRFNVLDTHPDTAIDSLAQAAAAICEAPIALVSLVDTNRQWFKAALGLTVRETPREHSFCAHAIEEPDSMMVIEDATKDYRFKDNPLVTGEPNIRFYSGKPLISPDGHALGTLCVIDRKPRQLTETQLTALSHLADATVDLLCRPEQSIFAAINLAVEQSLQHGITISDSLKPNNPMVYCNKAFELITAYGQDELLGRNIAFLQGDNTDHAAVEMLNVAVAEQSQVTVTLRYYRKDGTTFWNEVTMTPVKDKAGVATYFVGIHKDVSARYKMEAALSQSRKFIESAPDAMIFSDLAGNIKMANSETARLYGHSLDELSKMNIAALTAERFRPLRNDFQDRLLSDPKALDGHSEYELVGLTKSGKELMLDARLRLIETDDGMLISASIRDISSKLEAEAALRKSEERYKDLIENSSDLIQSVNLDGKFSYVNPAWLKAFGYSAEEASTLSILDIVCPSNAEHCQNLIEQILAGESMPHVEVVFKTKTGEPLYLEGSVSTSLIDGKVNAIRTIFRDVTERLKTEKLLVLAKESAENATTTKSRFLAAASHDLRQPLQSASMYIATLARQLDKPDEAKELCAMAAKSLESMGSLLDVLLDLTTLDAGGIEPEKQAIFMQEILDSIVTSNQQQAEQKGLTFGCEYSDVVVHSDPVLLERIIENFVSNAIRYTDQGSVNIRCRQRDQAILISVSDSGVGIPLDQQGNIFEEYVQLNNQARERSKGLGLGLSIVRRIARLLDHPLEVLSEPAKGSTFSILVPLGETALLDSSSSETVFENQASSPVVLLVDDDEYVLKSTARLLKTYDMEVYSAVNGDEALAQLANGLNPDFLLSDFRLPNYDGIELVKRIRHILSRDLPSALMTGDTSTTKILETKLPNFTVMHKPIDINRLLALIADSVV